MKMSAKFIYIAIGTSSALAAWEDHPDRQDFRDSDRTFKEAQNSTGCSNQDRSTIAFDAEGRDTNSSNGNDNDDHRACIRDDFGTPDRDR